MKKIFCILLSLTLLLGVLAACDKTPEAAEVNYTVSFETNGGSPVSPLVLAEGAGLHAPKAPLKDNYVFEGWYEDEALTRKFSFGVMPAKDIVLYAKWTRASANDGANDGSVRMKCDGCKLVTNCVLAQYDGEMLRLCYACRAIYDANENGGAGGSADSETLRTTCDRCTMLADCVRYEHKGEMLRLCRSCKALCEADPNLDIDAGKNENTDAETPEEPKPEEPNPEEPSPEEPSPEEPNPEEPSPEEPNPEEPNPEEPSPEEPNPEEPSPEEPSPEEPKPEEPNPEEPSPEE